MKQIANIGLMSETGCSGLVHWDDPEGQDEEHIYTHGGFKSIYGKTNTML